MQGPKLSLATLKVLSVLVEDPLTCRYGLELMDATKLASGTVYPILARLEKHGWIEGDWEEIGPAKEGRRPRRFYKLTPNGLIQVRSAMNQELTIFREGWGLST